MNTVYVTNAFLPPQQDYLAYLDRIWNSHILTNQGELVCELEQRLANYLDVPHFLYMCNGTVALQLAIHALGITDGEIITTPFSYVATTSAVLWERCQPVYVDIEPKHFCIDPSKIEKAITPNTRAILATHVFGYACDTEQIGIIAEKYGIPVIYDAAHAFGCVYKGKSLLSYGNIATCSFHATKVFHTIEGGGCAVHSDSLAKILDITRRFGHHFDNHIQLGINAKSSEFHAAMGLCNLKYLKNNYLARKEISRWYDELLPKQVIHPKLQDDFVYNYGYYAVLFPTKQILHEVFKRLAEIKTYPRRYFYPSLNRLPYLKKLYSCPVSEDVASRIACLPLYAGLSREVVENICRELSYALFL